MANFVSPLTRKASKSDGRTKIRLYQHYWATKMTTHQHHHHHNHHNQQHNTTTVQVQMTGRTVLDRVMHKLPSTRKYYRVTLIVPDNGIPIIEYQQANSTKKPKKSIQFVDLLFADRKHDTNEKFAFSLYTISKTLTFLAQDETTMNEWLSRIRELHSEVYPEMRYESIFEANLLDKGDLAKTMNIRGPYRLALCKDSLDLIPVLNAQQLLAKQQAPETQRLPQHQRNYKLWKYLTIELGLRTIRRCGHTDSVFYIESGRHSRLGAGDLWMALNKKSTARQLHELLLATMKQASTAEDQFICKPPRSRSGSSSENAQRAQQSRSSSLICLASDPTGASTNITTNTTSATTATSTTTATATTTNSTSSTISNNINTMIASVIGANSKNNASLEDESGYLPMA